MQFNCTFTTYRRETSGGGRQYAAGATITDGSGYYEPASGELQAVLGLERAVKAYVLLTPETDFKISDKVVINSDNYYIEGMEQLTVSSLQLTRAILTLKA